MPGPTTSAGPADAGRLRRASTWASSGAPAIRCSTLGSVGFHPRALAGGKDDGESRSFSHAALDRCQIALRSPSKKRARDGEREGDTSGALILSLRVTSRIAAASSWNGDLSSPNPERGP